MQYVAKDLFQLQSELVDAKVDVAVSNAIDRVVDQIRDLRDEVHELKASMENRFIAVEIKLSVLNEREKEIRNKLDDRDKEIHNRLIEYTFRAGWVVAASLVTYLIFNLQHLH